MAKYITNRRRKYKEKLVELKGGKCEVCGYDKCIGALEFHHEDESAKDAKISLIYNRGWERILKEIDKTKLLCANCHREIHENFKSDAAVNR